MNEIVSMSTKQAIEYLEYQGPVFQKSPLRLSPEHENYPALKNMVAELYRKGVKE